MAEFIYLNGDTSDVWYPVGLYFSHNFNFIEKSAHSINKIFPKGNFILVGRGHSGSILAGSIAYILKSIGREVLISISRKSDSSHGKNLEGIYKNLLDNSHLIVIDDFICSGKTVEAIIKDLTERLKGVEVFDMLCISNLWDESNLTNEEVDLCWKTNKRIADHFRYILCNKPA